jgi:hypothetical protein
MLNYKRKDGIRPPGLFAAPCETNAVITSFTDFCLKPLCCGNRKIERRTDADCWRRQNTNKWFNSSQSNNEVFKPFVGARDGFISDQRGKGFSRETI